MSEPTEYDLQQDQRIIPLEEILSQAAEPPTGDEFSYPVVGQGWSASMWSWMTLGQGSGLLDVGGRPYWLRDFNNATNTARLSVSTTVGTANAILRGYFHELSQDVAVSLPMPSGATITYHICLTFDPRNEKNAEGPISVETYSGTPPKTFGRHHLVLWTVQRSANQLLTDAVVMQVRQKVAPTITVDTEGQRDLLDLNGLLWGTMCLVSETGEMYRAGGSGEDVGGPNMWLSLTSPAWTDSTSNVHQQNPGSAMPAWRRIGDRVEFKGRIRQASGTAYQAGNDYTPIPNAPDVGIGGRWAGGCNSRNQPVMLWGNRGSKPVVVSNTTSPWIELSGLSYYWK